MTDKEHPPKRVTTKESAGAVVQEILRMPGLSDSTELGRQLIPIVSPLGEVRVPAGGPTTPASAITDRLKEVGETIGIPVGAPVVLSRSMCSFITDLVIKVPVRQAENAIARVAY